MSTPWAGGEIVGSHETFFLNDGSKALLFAAKAPYTVEGEFGPITTLRLRFFVATYTGDTAAPLVVQPATDVFDYSESPLYHVSDNPDPVAFDPALTSYVEYVQVDNKILALSNGGETARLFFVGETKKAKAALELPGPIANPGMGPVQELPGGGTSDPVPIPYNALGEGPLVVLPDRSFVTSTQETADFAFDAVLSGNTLISNDANDNTYRLDVFFTYANEFGETVASLVTTVKMQRSWPGGWLLYANAGASDDPDPAAPVTDPKLAADQLLVFVPNYIHDANVAAGATKLLVYAAGYSVDDPRPVEALLVDTHDILGDDYDHGAGWGQILAGIPEYTTSAPTPNSTNRRNYSRPPTGGQAIVAADRLVSVYDPVSPAVIRWTSNLVGEYLNFTAWKGGGFKTLTSGNLLVPGTVKLWQNPQSVDTLTILCLGVDGYSTGYYMSPAQIAQQSEATNVMGFEETTATPGTTSPYGCEVANNALYHPLDHQLMKSTAANYNINHKSMTDLIRDRWVRLVNKDHIVSLEHDSRLYYLVHNAEGETLEADCRGNEIWVLDLVAKVPTWNRWLIQGCSLRTVEVEGRIFVTVVRPDGIFALDDTRSADDVVVTSEFGETVEQRNIAWRFETNTQGANRAHDAWAHLQQANVQVGNFQGSLRFGIRGRDVHGRPVQVEKVLRDDAAPGDQAWDLEDYLLIRRDLKEWFFFASSVEVESVVQPSAGQINLVQYRYTPSTVNTGYEYGSVETFEYGRAGNDAADRNTDNGVPMPYIDTARP